MKRHPFVVPLCNNLGKSGRIVNVATVLFFKTTIRFPVCREGEGVTRGNCSGLPVLVNFFNTPLYPAILK
jgi:hypothetical protein